VRAGRYRRNAKRSEEARHGRQALQRQEKDKSEKRKAKSEKQISHAPEAAVRDDRGKMASKAGEEAGLETDWIKVSAPSSE
jgi:hypothetical protein